MPEPRPRSRLFCSHCQCLPRDPGSFGSQAGHPSSLIAISTPLFHSENRCWLFSSSFPQSCGRPPCNLHLTPGMTTYCRHLPQLVAGLIFHDEHPRPHSQFRRRIPPEPKGKAMDPLLDPVSPLSLTSGRSFRLPFWPDIFFQHVDPVSCPHRHESLSWHGLSDYRSFCLFFWRPTAFPFALAQNCFFLARAFSASSSFRSAGFVGGVVGSIRPLSLARCGEPKPENRRIRFNPVPD